MLVWKGSERFGRWVDGYRGIWFFSIDRHFLYGDLEGMGRDSPFSKFGRWKG